MNLSLAILFLSHLYKNFSLESALILTHKKCIETITTSSLMLTSLRFSNSKWHKFPWDFSLWEIWIPPIFFSHLLIYKRIFSSLHISLSSWGLKATWKIYGDCDNWLIIYRLIACLKEFQEAWRPFVNSVFSMFPLILLSLQILLCSWIKSQLSFCSFS